MSTWGAMLARLMKGTLGKSGKVAVGDSIVDSPCGRQCCTSREGVHTKRRGLDLGDENEKKGLRS